MEPRPHPHVFEANLERDQEALRERLRQSADLVVANLRDALTALAERDRKLAYSVILRDNRIDVLEVSLDRMAQEFLVRHMPVGAMLRFTISLFKVNAEIERAGDYAEAIARRAVSLRSHGTFPGMERLLEAGRVAVEMLRQAVDAFLARDTTQAMSTVERDPKVNAMSRALFAELARVETSEKDLTGRFILLGVLNRVERVADRACNIAEETMYVVKGEVLRHIPRHDVPILFLCEENAVRSQMAEAIARQLGPPYMRFTSAGLRPRAVDERAVEFMAKKGLDISRQRSKSLADVGGLDEYAVVVTLSAEADENLPQVPYKTIALHWDLPDPSRATGTDADREAVFQSVYDELRTKIGELLEGLSGARDEREEKA